MMARGKRKATAISPERRTKRVSATRVSSNSASDSEYAGEEDVGRDESEGMLAIAEMAKRFTKEDPFFEGLRQDIAADEEELQKLIDDKEREISNLNLSFDAQLRALLTTILGTSGHHAKPTVRVKKRGRAVSNESATVPSPGSAHPGFDHSSMLFAKSERLLKYYKGAETAISGFEGADGAKARFETDKAEVGRLILIGEEMTKRKIEGVLQRSEDTESARLREKRSKSKGRPGTPGQRVSTPRKRVVEKLVIESEVEEAEAVFAELRERRLGQAVENGEIEEEELAGDKRVAAIYPLLHGIEKGAEKMVRHVPVDD